MTDPDERFRRLFRQNYRSLMVYAMRRTERRPDAEDAVAEAFAVAWRRSRNCRTVSTSSVCGSMGSHGERSPTIVARTGVSSASVCGSPGTRPTIRRRTTGAGTRSVSSSPCGRWGSWPNATRAGQAGALGGAQPRRHRRGGRHLGAQRGGEAPPGQDAAEAAVRCPAARSARGRTRTGTRRSAANAATSREVEHERPIRADPTWPPDPRPWSDAGRARLAGGGGSDGGIIGMKVNGSKVGTSGGGGSRSSRPRCWCSAPAPRGQPPVPRGQPGPGPVLR